jgi:Mrp family chromosome partitioning ATPase
MTILTKGVGKSSITLQLALTLYLKGFKVGVLDIDLTGPSMPRMLGLEGRHIHQSSAGWIPVYLDNSRSLSEQSSGQLCCMSIGFLLRDRGDSVVWRGPKKGSMIAQFVEDVVWGELDYLLIDTPPGLPPSGILTNARHVG